MSNEQVIIDREAPPWAQRLQTDLNAILARLSRRVPRYFQSEELTITAAGEATVAHGLGAEPKIVQLFLRCKTAEHGYAVGDLAAVQIGNYDNLEYGSTVSVKDANLYVQYGTVGPVFWIHEVGTGVAVDITPANWRLVVRAWA
jgi:hypothetical protein